MTTAPKLIRELQAITYRLSNAVVSFKLSKTTMKSLAQSADDAVQDLRSLAAEPVGGVSGLTLAVIGRNHFGNPIPQEWYSAARELLGDAQPDSAEGDWQEDFSHENGDYENICCHCGKHFRGHKRRVTCKRCIKQPVELEDSDVLRQALWECFKLAGGDTDDRKNPDGISSPDLLIRTIATVRDLRECYDEALSAAPQPEQTRRADFSRDELCDIIEQLSDDANKTQPEQPARDGVEAKLEIAHLVIQRLIADGYVSQEQVDDAACSTRETEFNRSDWPGREFWAKFYAPISQPPQQADGGAVLPAGYHYVYRYPFNGNEVIVTTSTGGDWNGQKPIRSMPYYYDPPKSPGVGDEAWHEWANKLRELIGDRTGVLHLAADVQAEGDGVRFTNTRFVSGKVTEEMVANAYCAFINAKVHDPADTRERMAHALLAALGGEK